MPSNIDRVLSGSPYGFKDGLSSEELDPDSVRQMLLAIGRGAVAEPVSGLAGIASLPFGIDKAVSNMEGVNKFIGYQPTKTDHMEYVGQAVKPISDWVSKNVGDLREKAGDWTLDKTGSPGLAAAAHSIPEIAALGLTGGAMVPAVRAVNRASKTVDGVADQSRRRALGLMGGGAAVAGAMALAPKVALKSIMDVPSGAGLKAGATATRAAASAIPRAVVNSHTLRMINMLKAYPVLKSAFKKGGKEGYLSKLDVNEGVPLVDADNDYLGVDWDDVSKHLDNNRLETNSKGYDYDIESVNMTDIAPRYFKENKNAVDINEYMVGSGELFSEADFKRYLKSRAKDTPETKGIIKDMLKDDKAYDNYIKTYDKQLNEYGGEYSF